MAPVTLKQLRAIAAVARTGTVIAAARELHVTPPAVTTQMHLLEAAYGVPLTARLGDRFVPTEAGEEVLAAAARVEAALRMRRARRRPARAAGRPGRGRRGQHR